MVAQGRVGLVGRALWVLFSTTAAVLSARAEPFQPQKLPVESGRNLSDPLRSDAMRSDARLADVHFVDPRHGWAVGDRGTIWHTENGGGHWYLQNSGVGCRLQSVFFIDRQNGWAAGGYTHPYTHSSTGVVLITRDGGRRWSHNPNLLLPALKQVRFFNLKHGWAVGCSSAMFPSGLFVTESGGQDWKPVPGGKSAGWQAGDFTEPYTGVVAGQDGMAAIVRRGRVEPAQTPRFGLRRLRRMKMATPLDGWLVGQGGLVMMTRDLGVTWQTTPGELPQDAAGQFDFAALAVIGPKAWVAGSPGTRVFHTPDAGQTWFTLHTGQSLPICNLCFVDERNGWAVGELGTILATTDGGQTWQRQHSGGTRAALLGLFGGPKDVPLELFARFSGNEGYLGVVELLGRHDVETPANGEVHPADRVHEAMVGVGASSARTAWRFPLRQTGLRMSGSRILDGWDQANDGRGLNQLQAHLVRNLRLWRPEVVVTHAASPLGDDPLGHLIHQAVLDAVQLAADPTAHAQQITRAGLEPWKVKKVYASLGPGVHGDDALTTSELAARLGRSLAEVASGPRGLVEDRFAVEADVLGFRLLVDHLPQHPGRSDFFTGIVLHPGGEARRQLIEPPAESLDLIRRIAQRRRNTRAILQRTDRDPQQGLGLLAQAGELTRGLDPDSSAQTLYHLAQRYYGSGHWPMAAEAFELLTDRHPQHPLTRPALAWLVQYYASGEAAWRVYGSQRFMVQQASAPALNPLDQENRPERAAALGKQIERTLPGLFAAPSIGFPLAVADRQRGFPRRAERFFMILQRSVSRDAWWACAEGEKWLAEPEGSPPKPVLHCTATPAKPLLDGRLDDAVWQHAKSAELESPQHDDAQWPAAVMLAYDKEFLYLAIRCRQAPGAEYETTKGPRPRDPDLSGRDRVELYLDLDRDFVTYYRLAIDHRGWTGEGCWGDSTWNPTWFVAARTEDGTWTAEAAVPLDQLTGQYPRSRTVWAVGIQRIAAGVGFQSWNTPAAASVQPEGFGYLIFE